MARTGTIYMGQTLKFIAPVFVNDKVRVDLEVIEVQERARVRMRTDVTRIPVGSDEVKVIEGEALIKSPRNRVVSP